MEICGGQTHALLRFGIDRLLPPEIRMVHGPGCPVCVTPADVLDRAVEIAALPGVTFVSFGDMLRVPGSRGDLLGVKARGGDVRVVYSPLDAVEIARACPDREVVFFAVGFETTAPANATAVHAASTLGLANFSVLVSHVLVPPAIEAILSASDNQVQAFLAAGHVCTVTGTAEYEPIARKYRVPIVVTGFEPLDLLQGILMAVRQLEAGRGEVENAYARSVRPAGNPGALRIIREVFEVRDKGWRGIGVIPESGLFLRPSYREFDADLKFPALERAASEPSPCRAGDVLRGVLRPDGCPEFAVRCHPENPLGAPMVSSEGACAAYWRYRRAGLDQDARRPEPAAAAGRETRGAGR
jgi:hydrogenase expression/formation protein HypD